eukprot:GHVU01047580.1.p1 GENE.GHVU01047580.1~~GHVU01047580.1.p1  ORF type:complete len:267 (-),score=39.88 GHVU01047580.1:165-965(-)
MHELLSLFPPCTIICTFMSMTSDDAMKNSCPVCLEDLFASTSTVVMLKCGHAIHAACQDNMRRSAGFQAIRCPLCFKSFEFKDSPWPAMDREIAETEMPAKYRKVVEVCCNDCHAPSITNFHFVGLRCMLCGSYNTAEIGVVEGAAPIPPVLLPPPELAIGRRPPAPPEEAGAGAGADVEEAAPLEAGEELGRPVDPPEGAMQRDNQGMPPAPVDDDDDDDNDNDTDWSSFDDDDDDDRGEPAEEGGSGGRSSGNAPGGVLGDLNQ